MFNYKRDSRKKIHLIKKYVKRIRKASKTDNKLNNVNNFILDNCILKNIIASKYFPEKIINNLSDFIYQKKYRIVESDIIYFFNTYRKEEKYRFNYWEIKSINQMVFYILITKLYNIITVSYPGIIKENTRKNIQIYNIILTINELYNWDIDQILMNTNDCDILLSRIQEYNFLDSESRNKYREKIIVNSKKYNKTEYIYAIKLMKKYKNTDKNLCELLFRRINYKIVNFFVIIVSIVLSILLSSIIFINKLLFIPILIINYSFIYRFLSSKVPKDFVPKYNFEKYCSDKKIMVFKYIDLNSDLVIEKELKIFEKMYLENKSKDIDFTLCIESDKPISDLKKYNNNLINKAYLECRKLNNKHSREIFFVIYVKNNNDIKRYNTLSFFNKLLLHKNIDNDSIDYFLGNNNYSSRYKYVLNIDQKINNINICSLVNYLLHPYNTPIFKNNKFTYGYGSISLDGVNLYNESIDSINYLYDLELFDKLYLKNNYNFLRDYSINNYKKKYSINSISVNVNLIRCFFHEKSHLNFIYKIKIFHKLINILENICSFILLFYFLFNDMSILWIIYLMIFSLNFSFLPTIISYNFIDIITKKDIILKNFFQKYANYIMCLFLLFKIFITGNNILSTFVSIICFLYGIIIKKYIVRSDNIDQI